MGTRAHQTKAVERLLSWLQQREDQMAALLADLIAIPTENPPGRQYREFVEVLEKQTERLGLAFRRLEPPSRPGAGGDVPECLSASHGQGAPFYFHGHYDVVPAQSEKQFQPQRKDHFVFGRGASDMKGGIVSMLYAIVGLKEGTGQSRNSVLMLGGQSGGGTNFNVVPETCWFTIDRRVNPEEDLREEKARLIGVLNECRQQGIALEWELLQEGNSASCQEGESTGQALAEAIREITGATARFELCPGLLETRFYAARGVPSYAYGPGRLSVAHGPNE